MGFKGAFHDAVNEVVVLEGRPYDPIVGRYLSFDLKSAFAWSIYQPEATDWWRLNENDPVNVRKNALESKGTV